MAHTHSVVDTDARFVIDTATRAINRVSGSKNGLMQYDHNSERFTFEMPRYIEGHDMSTCNLVNVHYLNIEHANKKEHSGLYEVDDLAVDSEDESKVVFSWLIKRGATQYHGKLDFLVSFVCTVDGFIEYAWHTNFFTDTKINKGLDATGAFETEYVEIIERWRKSVMAHFTNEIGAWKTETAAELRQEAEEAINALATYVTPQMFGAKGDGVTDDTDAVQAALASHRHVYIPEGVYMIRTSTDDTAEYNDGEGIGVEIPSNTRLVMHNNAVLKGIPNKSSRYRVLWATDRENIFISGGRIECDKESATGEHGHGLVLRNCKKVTVENMVICNALADCILVGGNPNVEDGSCENITIRGCELYGSRRQGITFGRSDSCLVDGCYIHDVSGKDPQSGIDIEVDFPETQTATNIKINNCRFENNANYDIIAATYGVVEVIGCKCANKIWNERGVLTVRDSAGAIYHYTNAQSTDIIGCTVPVLYSYGTNCRCVGSVLNHLWTDNELIIENSTINCDGKTHGIMPYDGGNLVINNSHVTVKNCKYGVNGNRATFNHCVVDVYDNDDFKMFAYLIYGEFNDCIFSIDTAAKDLAYANGSNARVKFRGCKFLTDFFVSINASSVKYLVVGNIFCVEPSALLANETYVHDNFNAY